MAQYSCNHFNVWLQANNSNNTQNLDGCPTCPMKPNQSSGNKRLSRQNAIEDVAAGMKHGVVSSHERLDSGYLGSDEVLWSHGSTSPETSSRAASYVRDRSRSRDFCDALPDDENNNKDVTPHGAIFREDGNDQDKRYLHVKTKRHPLNRSQSSTEERTHLPDPRECKSEKTTRLSSGYVTGGESMENDPLQCSGASDVFQADFHAANHMSIILQGLQEGLSSNEPIDPARFKEEIVNDESFPFLSFGSLGTDDILISEEEPQEETNSCRTEDRERVEIQISPQQETEDDCLHGNGVDVRGLDLSVLQENLEQLSHCKAMQCDHGCFDLKCEEAKTQIGRLESYYQGGNPCYEGKELGIRAREVAQALWAHTRACSAHRCVVPFCAFFKHLYEKDAELDFDDCFGCMMARAQVDVLRNMYELEELQKTPLNGDDVWAPDDNARKHLMAGKPRCRITPDSALSKFGHFGLISCTMERPDKKRRVVIKKVSYCPELGTLLRSSSSFDPVLSDLVSTCHWYRQIKGDKLLICSSYLKIDGQDFSHCHKEITDKTKKMNLFCQAVEAAVRLHEYGIIYLNWKLDHIFVSHNQDSVKLCNLSCAVQISTHDSQPNCLTSDDCHKGRIPERVRKSLDPRIAPPEVLEGGQVSMKSDTWGLGCLLYQLDHNGCLPYYELRHDSDERIIQMRKEDEQYAVPQGTLSGRITERVWHVDQAQRSLPGELPDLIERSNYIERLLDQWGHPPAEGDV